MGFRMKQEMPFPLDEFSFQYVRLDRSGRVIELKDGRGALWNEKLAGGQSLQVVALPGGFFSMGSMSGQGYIDETPRHGVQVAPFFLGRQLVTQAQWQAVMKKAPRSRFSGENLPVENISWSEALEFCKKLSKQSRHAYRLPSEAEWEYACRAGTSTAFSTGETINTDFANYCGEHIYLGESRGLYRHCTTPAEQLLPNPYGLLEMHGNLWEFCADRWHADYNGAPLDSRPWESSGEKGCRVARGGSWHEPPGNCRCSTRLRVAEKEGDDIYGFRVAMSL